MNIDEVQSINDPSEIESQHVKAIWYALHDGWDEAHRAVQRLTDVNAMWIHAYLHRVEPDEWNAKYWYRKAGKPFPGDLPFDEEIGNILESIG